MTIFHNVGGRSYKWPVAGKPAGDSGGKMQPKLHSQYDIEYRNLANRVTNTKGKSGISRGPTPTIRQKASTGSGGVSPLPF